MDREEILRKAQSQPGMDEREMLVMQKGSTAAMWVGAVAALALMVCKKAAGEPWQDLYCLYATMLAILNLYKGAKLRQKHHLLVGVAWAVLAGILLVVYLVQIFR